MKIITAGFYDNGDEALYTLSEEESQSFNKMIVAVLVSTLCTVVLKEISCQHIRVDLRLVALTGMLLTLQLINWLTFS